MPRRRPSPPWIGWLLGLALLSAVVTFALHVSEGRELVRVIREAEPWWVVVAAGLQALTYLAQGEVWRVAIHGSGSSFSRPAAFRLAIAKLFVDQAIPSAGLSGSMMMAHALARRGVPRRVIMAVLSVQTSSFYLGYLAAVLIGLTTAAARRTLSPFVLALSLTFAVMVSAVAVLALWVPGHHVGSRWRGLVRLRPVREALEMLMRADPRIARRSPVLIVSAALQLLVILLDAATLWTLLRALGVSASPLGVFVSFVLSSVFRTMGVVPGGLGTFEAASVITLRACGVTVPAALGATLLFRALSFWIPMLPGMWLSRRV